MTRILKNPPKLERVETYPVAEHRYLWTGREGEAEIDTSSPRAVRLAAPYKRGDVILAEIGEDVLRCYIVDVLVDLDRFGDWRELYTVLPETKKGTFSTQFRRVFPGYVQRAYKRAGRAPEMPDNA